MKNTEEMRAILENDCFATGAGIVLGQVEDGCAVCSVQLGPQHLNAAGVAQGGLVFTLADFAFAAAANSCLPSGAGTAVTLNCDIHYFSGPGEGQRLVATATPASLGRRITVYQVDVRTEEDTPVALATITGYVKSARPQG